MEAGPASAGQLAEEARPPPAPWAALRAMLPWDRTDGLVLGLSQESVRLLVHAVQQRAPTPKDLELSCRCPACDRGLSLGARTDLLSVRDRQTDSGKAFRSGDLTDTSR